MASSWLLLMLAPLALMLTGCDDSHWVPMSSLTCPKYCELSCWVYDKKECQEVCGESSTCENEFCEAGTHDLNIVYGDQTVGQGPTGRKSTACSKYCEETCYVYSQCTSDMVCLAAEAELTFQQSGCTLQVQPISNLTSSPQLPCEAVSGDRVGRSFR
eukprot:TRINITY_DN7688_c0_g1_i1.p1 TRINITY_DN7688_c0_g1~~TRINITY_DN7688_c0_g1_i1.p1  ORF type:complete len:158 (-),score=20.09 TRINITY_DN7688_c0_g1_i1:91-564(-)